MTNICLMAELEARVGQLRRQLPASLEQQELRQRLVALLATDMGVQGYIAEEAVDGWLSQGGGGA